ncbi:hypothetical protein D9M70_511850 [compost metagenome]
MQAPRVQHGIPAAPALVAHQAAATADLSGRSWSTRLVAYAAHPLEGGLLSQHGERFGMIQPGLGHHRVGHAVAVGQSMNEASLAEWIAMIPLTLDVDGLHHSVGADIGEVVLRVVAALQGAVIAIAERDIVATGQPRVIVQLRVPEVVVGVDYRAVPQGVIGHTAPPPPAASRVRRRPLQQQAARSRQASDGEHSSAP